MIRVTRLQMTPVKGTRLHECQELYVGPNGVADNRRFYLVNERGLLFNGKREGRLVQLYADYDHDRRWLSVRFPDGRTVAARWSAAEPIVTDFYGSPVSGRVVIGPWAEAISAFVGRPVRLVIADREGGGVDVHPVTLLSRASLDAVRASVPGAERLDHRRFRILVEVDGVEAHREDAWAGEALQLGDATIQVVGPVPRCVVTTQNPDDGLTDFKTLDAILAYRGARSGDDLSTPTAHLPDNGKIVFGVYAQVVQPGRVRVGDELARGLPLSGSARP